MKMRLKKSEHDHVAAMIMSLKVKLNKRKKRTSFACDYARE